MTRTGRLLGGRLLGGRVLGGRIAAAVRRIPSRTPLRVTLMAVVLVLVAAALTGAGLAGTFFLRRYLVDRVDDGLRAISGMAVDVADGGSRFPGGPGSKDAPNGFQPGGPGRFVGPRAGEFRQPETTALYIAILDGTGTPVPTGPATFNVPTGMAQSAPRLPRMDAAAVRAHAGRPFTVPAQGAGYPWLVRVSPLRSGTGSAVAAVSLNEVESEVDRLAMYETLIGAVALLLVGVAAYLLIGRSLRRLVDVERTAEAIAAGDLGRRVPVADPSTEVGRLAVALNSMLGHIEGAFVAQRRSQAEAEASEERMRRFVADASHELRTPLTAIRGFAELQRRRAELSRADMSVHSRGGTTPEPVGTAGVDDVMSRIEQHAIRMGLLVEDLLLLARLDQQRPLERRPVDLLDLAGEGIMDARVTAPDHPVRLRATSHRDAAPPVVVGDPARLRQVLGNLLSNAFTHTPAGTPVTVTVGTSGDAVILAVSDEGPGMTEEDAVRVFERFFRTDPSRTRAHGGAGLGLSIVAALVAAHGGTVTVDTAPGAGTCFTVRLPLADPTAPDHGDGA